MLAAENLSMRFALGGKRALTAVDSVSLALTEGATTALVGESGCGKSTLAKLFLKLLEPTEGKVLFDGRDISDFDRRETGAFRRAVQMIFQDPYASLNPRQKVASIVGEPMEIHGLCPKEELREKVLSLLKRVGLDEEAMERYPREFSGGQRQRIGIARALAVEPRIMIADEPVSALDVSVQAQVLNLLSDLKEERNLTLLFISHDMRVVKVVSDRVVVMYLGKLVEDAPKEVFFAAPAHPYSQLLLRSVPNPDPLKKEKAELLKGDPPSPVDRPRGCPFHPRCPERMAVCETAVPLRTETGEGAKVWCHLYG